MRNQNRSSNRRSYLVLGVMLMIGAPTVACVGDLAPSTPNPRLGREKRVLFSSGCSSSLSMPVGATDTLVMQTADDNVPLPQDLAPKSADPTIIEVSNISQFTFDMHGLKKGKTDIQAISAGSPYDSITFQVEPARAVKFKSEPAVLAGGRTGIAIMEVFGACGTDECPLFGHNFVKWTADPATAFTFVEDTENLGHYRATTTPGSGALVGSEPSEGGELARQPVEIVDPALITSMSGTWANLSTTEQGTDPKQIALPVSIAPMSSFEIRVMGDRSGKPSVPISRFDIEWTVPAGLSQDASLGLVDPFASQFSSSAMTGDFTLTAKVGLLGDKEQKFVVTVKAP